MHKQTLVYIFLLSINIVQNRRSAGRERRRLLRQMGSSAVALLLRQLTGVNESRRRRRLSAISCFRCLFFITMLATGSAFPFSAASKKSNLLLKKGVNTKDVNILRRLLRFLLFLFGRGRNVFFLLVVIQHRPRLLGAVVAPGGRTQRRERCFRGVIIITAAAANLKLD
jgi:hypothetical protein